MRIEVCVGAENLVYVDYFKCVKNWGKNKGTK